MDLRHLLHVAAGGRDPVEVFLLSPVEDADLVELLYMVATFHRADARLDLGHTVNIGRPWLMDSECDHGLLSLPYLDGPRVEEVRDQAGDIVCRAYWFIPITKAERELKKAEGLEALEQAFEAAQFDYLDPSRPSVV